MQRYKSLAQFFSLVILDLASFYIALFLSVFIRTYVISFLFKDAPAFGFTYQYYISIWWIPLVFVLVFLFMKLYIVRFPFWEEFRIILKSVAIATLFVFLTVIVKNMYGNFSRLVLIFLCGFMIFLSPLIRFWGKKLLFRMGIWKESVLIIGAGDSGLCTLKGLVREEHLGYSIVGFLDDNPNLIGKIHTFKGKDYKVYGSIDNYDKFVNILKIETVIIANPGSNQDELTELVNRIYKAVKRVIIIPDIKGVAIFNSDLHYLFMEKLFMIKVNNNLNSLTNTIIKRCFDLFFSLTGFIIASPLYLILTLLIKLTSKGPVIFSHKRIGRNGVEFNAYKFRTMYCDAQDRLKHILAANPEACKEWETNYKLKNDPRVTPIGKILRAASLDEIPQIFNIIKGDMSLVGPRPVIQDEIDKYYGDHKEYYYSVTPGLTGLWQLSGRSNTDYTFRIETDAWYVQNWSLWLDVIILFKTIPAVLKREGAY